MTRLPVAEVVPGESWGAVVPRKPLAPRGPLRAVVIHHTAEPPAPRADSRPEAEAEYMRAIQAEHLARGWWAIGYHYVVMPSGRVYAGRPPDAMGAHVEGHNHGTLGICLAGNFEHERPTGEALLAVERLLAPLPPVPVLGHRDLAETACPGRHLTLPLARSGLASVED